MKYILLAVFYLLFITNSEAQNLVQQVYNIEVYENEALLPNAWLGGLYNPQFHSLDIDSDNDLDLVIFDSQGNSFLCFENRVIDNLERKYIYQSNWANHFPKSENWVQLNDYNCDGIKDLFSYEPNSGHVYIYKGSLDLNGLVVFDESPNLLNVKRDGVDVLFMVNQFDRPQFVDVNFDGDLDMLVFNDYDQIDYYENQSIETTGNCTQLNLKLETDCWGQFEEDVMTSEVYLDADCNPNLNNSENHNLHIGFTRMLLYDADQDQDMDLIYGYGRRYGINSLMNGGDANNAIMSSVDSLFPINNITVNFSNYPAPYLLDADLDGQKELIFSPSNEGLGKDNCWLYQNNGTEATPVWELEYNNFLQQEMLNVGANSHPTLIDYDSDGDLDLVISNKGEEVDVVTFAGSLALYENTGTDQNPVYDWISDDWLSLSHLNLKNIKITFGDLDSDGDEDVLIGEFRGRFFYFENIATQNEEIQININEIQELSIDIGDLSTPQLVDIDQDGLLDLISGEVLGRIFYYRNTGTAQAFDFVLENDFWGEVSVRGDNSFFGYSVPHLVQLKAGTPRILFVGNIAGEIFAYDGVDENWEQFELNDADLTNIQVGAHASPTILIGENDHYLYSGTIRGGLQAYSLPGALFLPTSIQHIEKELAEITIFPNPSSRNTIQVNWTTTDLSNGSFIQIYSSLGQLLLEQPVTSFEQKQTMKIGDLGLKNGIYFIKIGNRNTTSSVYGSFIYEE